MVRATLKSGEMGSRRQTTPTARSSLSQRNRPLQKIREWSIERNLTSWAPRFPRVKHTGVGNDEPKEGHTDCVLAVNLRKASPTDGREKWCALDTKLPVPPVKSLGAGLIEPFTV